MHMKMPNGEIYDVPDAEVGTARADYGAVPADSVSAGPTETDSNPMGAILGGASSAVNALGGPLRVGAGLGGAGVLYSGAKWLAGRAAAGRQAAAPLAGTPATSPAAAPLPAALPTPAAGGTTQTLTMTQAAAPASTATKPAGRVVGSIPRSSTKMPKLPAAKATKGVEPTVPIKVAGKPKAQRLAKQRGVSGRELAGRQAGMAAAEPESDLAAQLRKSLALEGELTKRGFSPAQKMALRRGIRQMPGALGFLLAMANAGSIPQEMDEARRITTPTPDWMIGHEDAMRPPEGI